MSAITTPADVINRFDERDWRELAVDDGSDASLINVDTDPRILGVIEDAEGEVRANLRKGGRYTDDDIAALEGCDLAYFKRIVAEVAMLHMLRRRPRFDPAALEAYEKIRDGHLKDIQSGNVILGENPEDIEASRACVDGPTVSETINQNFWVDRAHGYFPNRVYPRGRNI